MMTVQEASDYTRVSVSHIRRNCVSGKLPHFKLGRRIVIDRRDLEAWLNGHKIGSLDSQD
jgi:excisionase family DNA binding protein